MTPKFSHIVLFWLAEPENESHRRQFEASLTKFIESSRYVRASHIGTPAGTDREVVDNSYTYCLSVWFDSSADHDLYQKEDAHLQFIAECKPFWTRVQIYDSLAL